MKTHAITLPKREAQPLCEDASMAVANVLAVADGAGGGGLYADCWARYLLEHLPRTSPIATDEQLDQWIGQIWEPYYQEMEARAKATSSWHLNKFYDEGSFATLVAAWLQPPTLRSRRAAWQCPWMAYGDSVVLHYSPRTRRLSHSFGTLAQFLDGPSLLNCKDELQFGRLRVGHFALNRGEVLLLMSDALAQYVLMMYALQAGGSYAAQLQELEQRPSRLRDSLQQARALGNIYFWKDVLQPLLRSARSPQDFATHIDGLRRRGLLAHDDYSLAYAQR